MTRDEILNMPAGREMDALIALRVFGYEWYYTDGHQNTATWRKNRIIVKIGDYSTDIAAAWEVVEKFNNECMLNNVHGIWEVHFHGGVGESKSAPLAICRAALLAVMEDEG